MTSYFMAIMSLQLRAFC